MTDDPCRAWKSFAACAIPLIPILIRQMTAVTEQTEEAAMHLMAKLRTIAERAHRQADQVTVIMEGSAERPEMEGGERHSHVPARARQQADELTNDVNHIVMAMQFQDITRQRLEHIEQALTRLRDHFQRLLEGRPDEDLQDSLTLLKDLEHRYTMDAERRTHTDVSGGEPRSAGNISAGTEPAGAAVTLFES